jgi:acyl-CoA synthetase (AMP-forming)/AMP-acid ligase II
MSDSIPIADSFATIARRYAERIAVADLTATTTYDALFRKAAAMGLALIKAGVKPGDPVATFVRNGIPAVWSSLGVALSGGAEVALNTALGEGERRYCLDLAKARHIITAEKNAGLFETLGLQVHVVETIGEAGLRPSLFPDVTAEGWARIGFTSGTTGEPKGIVTSQQGRWFGNLLRRATLPYRPSAFSRLLLMTPFSHGASLLTYAYLDLGGSVLLLDGVDTDTVIDLLERGKVDEMFAPPTVLAKIVAAANGRHIPGLKTIFCGTAVLSPTLYQRARNIFGPVIRVTYGKSEVTNPITVLEPDETEAWYAEGGADADACVGWPATGVEILIADSEGCTVPAGKIGEVKIRAPQMLAGIIRPSAFEKLSPGAFHDSGDIGYIDKRGRLHLVGRSADVIKTGGYRVAPEEVERALSNINGMELAAFGLRSEYWGEVIVAAVEQAQPGWEDALRAAAATMTSYKQPRVFVEVDALPRNAIGKVSRKALREKILATHRLVDGPRPSLEPELDENKTG